MNLLTAKRTARVLADRGGYNLYAAGMNPLIFEEFIGEILDRDLEPVVWEPFSGPSAKRFLDFSESVMVNLISYDLNPMDDRVMNMDSTMNGPRVSIGGILFHPPYFGSAPLSGSAGDIGRIRDMDEYKQALRSTIQLGAAMMAPSSLVCVVGRHYRFDGKPIHLDAIMGELMENEGFRLLDVWISTPDIVQIMEKL